MKALIAILLLSSSAFAQTVGSYLPKQIRKSDKFLFYLHGGVVTELGNNAINQSVPEWVPYEYLNILDSLRKRGFDVISENRKPGVEESVYVIKIAKQIDSLHKAGVKTKRIIIVGASAGSNIVLNLSPKLKDRQMKYVIMGGCWPDAYKGYESIELYGKFLSIIETTDPHGTCNRIFDTRKTLTSWKEIKLNMGLSHGFICKGYNEWVDPVVDWFNEK